MLIFLVCLLKKTINRFPPSHCHQVMCSKHISFFIGKKNKNNLLRKKTRTVMSENEGKDNNKTENGKQKNDGKINQGSGEKGLRVALGVGKVPGEL